MIFLVGICNSIAIPCHFKIIDIRVIGCIILERPRNYAVCWCCFRCSLVIQFCCLYRTWIGHFLCIEEITNRNICSRRNGIGHDFHRNLCCSCSACTRVIDCKCFNPVVIAAAFFSVVFFLRWEIWRYLHGVIAEICIQSRTCTDKRCVIVNRYFVINPVCGNIIVLVRGIRPTNQCTIQNMTLLSGIFCSGQAGGCTVVRILCSIFAISDNISPIHRVVAHQILHLFFCPFAVFGRLAIVVVLVINQCTQLCSSIISGRAPGIQPEIACRCNRSDTACHISGDCLCNGCPAIHFFIGRFFSSFLVLFNKLRINVLAFLGRLVL